MRRVRPIFAILLVAVAALSWWLRDQAPPGGQGVERKGPREIDYYIQGFDVTRMTADGKPAHRLIAKRAHHYTDDDTTELHSPQLTVYQDESPPWEIDAPSALVSADGELVLLSGDVLIERGGDANNRPVRIATRDLRIQPHQDYAETDEKVRVDSESDWLDAIGMQAWFRPPTRLKFLSQVKGFYVPGSNTSD